MTSAEQPTVTVRPLTIPTYQLGAGRRHADFGLWKGRVRTYPYPRLDVWDPTPAPVTYQALVLQNEYLEATVLPELGGHVYSVVDRLTGEDLFFRNGSIRPALVAPRGAWIAGGIEYNFPVGHTLVTVSPVDWSVQQGPGEATVQVGHTDQVSGMRLRVVLRLSAGVRALEQSVHMENGSDLPQSFFYWCNAAVEACDDSRFVYPMRRVWCDEYPDELAWPLHEWVDLSLFRNNRRPSSHFALEQWGGFFGIYRPSTDSGTFHWAAPDVLPGRKAWTWGTAGDGLIWYDRLADDGRPYAEIQSGLWQNQRQFGMMPPGSRLTVSEWWLPVHGIGQPDWVDGGGASRLDGIAGVIHYQPARLVDAARLAAVQSDRELCALTADLDPAQPVRLRLPAGVCGILHLRVTAPDGTVLSDAALGGVPQTDRGIAVTPPEQPGPDRLCRRAAELENTNHWAEAFAAFASARAADSTSSAAALGMARVALRRGQWQQARELAKAAVDLAGTASRETAEANLLLGMALRATGEDQGARLPLRVALSQPHTAVPARRQLVELALAAGDLFAVAALLATGAGGAYGSGGTDGSGGFGGADPLLTVLAARRQGRAEQARAMARAALEADPLHPALRWEAGELPGVGDLLQLRREVATLYARTGDLEALLAVTEAVPGDLRLLAWKAWALLRLGRRSDAETTLGAASELSLDGAFPWQADEVRMLESLWSAFPQYGFLPAMLGAYYLAVERDANAVTVLEAAQELLVESGKAAAAVARNRALAYHRLGQHMAAAEAACVAVALDPTDSFIYAEADGHLAAVGWTERRRHLIQDGLAQGFTATPFLLRALAFFVAERDADEAVRLIESHTFHLIEGQLAPRLYYVSAYLMRGKARLDAGDAEGAVADFRQARLYPRAFGIGEPDRPDRTQALYLEGLAHHQRGDRGEAARCWEQVVAAAPRDESCYYRIAALRQLKRDEQATAALAAWLLQPMPNGPASRVLFLQAVQALAAGREAEGRRLLSQADRVEAGTGEDWADLLQRSEALVPEERRPQVIRSVML